MKVQATETLQKPYESRGSCTVLWETEGGGSLRFNRPVSESFFHTLKTELVHHQHYQTRAETKQELFEYIEVFYNRERLHSTNNYLPPVDYEMQLKSAQLCVRKSIDTSDSCGDRPTYPSIAYSEPVAKRLNDFSARRIQFRIIT